ncbi:MAG: TraR/DksA C4-type zinc finger protein [Patescibacteria group bacterium]|nr:TraR/DksA C4-type zinc finger protein [Patescibacteria group bacterium]
MNKKDLEYFKKKLLDEKASIEAGLADISKKEPGSPGGWEATSDIEVDAADENEVADKFEELEENTAISSSLEKQLADINDALQKIEEGKYGICEVCGSEIERGRLEANPSARTAIKHSHN